MKRKTLVAARERKGWDQQLLADHVYPQVSRTTVSNWECALKTPRPHYKGELCRVFGFDDPEVLLKIDYTDEQTNEGQNASTEASLAENRSLVSALPEEELHERMMADSEALSEEATSSDQSLLDPITPTYALSSYSLWRPHTPTLHDFIVSDPARHFWQIAHTDYDTPGEMTAEIQAAIKDMHMTTGDSITRREALCELASIPMISLGKTSTQHPRRSEEMLRFCTAALEGCWELYRGSDQSGAQHAFECVCTYIPMLETIARDSSKLRTQALDLAARYALLKTLLGWNCSHSWEAVGYAEHALFLSRESGSILLQLSAYTKASWAYIRTKQYTKAWEIMQKGELMLKGYQHKKNGPALPSGIIGNFCSSYCQAQVKNGISPDRELGITAESAPLDEPIAMVDFTIDGKFWETAWICAAKGDPEQAMVWLKKLIDTETLATHQGFPLNESDRFGAINILTDVLLQLPERDMGRIIKTWTTAMEGAQTHRHEVMYDQAMTNFAIMKALWRGERAIRDLMPLTSHW